MSTGGEAIDKGVFRCTLQVRWADFDQFGHVNNVTYFRWFESARIHYRLPGRSEGLPPG